MTFDVPRGTSGRVHAGRVGQPEEDLTRGPQEGPGRLPQLGIARKSLKRLFFRFTRDGTERVSGVQEGRHVSQLSLGQGGKARLQALKGLVHRIEWWHGGHE
jgi:hypothetical protein